ncbi:MAG TPA: hypothetical protein VFN25_09470 [Dokdonella sp.]|uniref:hypothetical protein n=1 Tax=Dokdonella sp. TaxID=2291710 RepID=UPI002D80D05D|nr:hypothetical protein [Dokdonella sp.]HET9033121.1 hypothetical protein [Dokdonella sp.]
MPFTFFSGIGPTSRGSGLFMNARDDRAGHWIHTILHDRADGGSGSIIEQA